MKASGVGGGQSVDGSGRGWRVEEAAGWRVKSSGAGGIWSLELAARRGQELCRRGCGMEPERVLEVSG